MTASDSIVAWSRLKVCAALRVSAGSGRTITFCYNFIPYSNQWEGQSLVTGVIGPVAPDYFAENMGDRRSARVTWSRSSAQLIPAAAVGSTTARSAGRYALPRLDECAQDRIVRAALGADCEIVINLDAYLVPRAVTRLRSSGARVVEKLS